MLATTATNTVVAVCFLSVCNHAYFLMAFAIHKSFMSSLTGADTYYIGTYCGICQYNTLYRCPKYLYICLEVRDMSFMNEWNECSCVSSSKDFIHLDWEQTL